MEEHLLVHLHVTTAPDLGGLDVASNLHFHVRPHIFVLCADLLEPIYGHRQRPLFQTLFAGWGFLKLEGLTVSVVMLQVKQLLVGTSF